MATASHPAWPPQFCLILACFFLVLITSSPVEGVGVSGASTSGRNDWQNVRVSWASGIVVPEGARLQGGENLSWTTVSNLTGVLRLPNITDPLGITYVLLSAMGNDGSVFQVGVGIWPGCEYWAVYSWFITGANTMSPSYAWMANSTTPRASSNDLISISIFKSQSGWTFRVEDVSTNSAIEKAFPATSVSFAKGDQEVLSLESYTPSAQTFVNMGNMTLDSLTVDGRRVVRGWYSYSGWDGIHNPLFVVGTSDAPYFVRLSLGTNGVAIWSYDALWKDEHFAVVLPIALGVIVLLSAAALILVRGRLRKPV